MVIGTVPVRLLMKQINWDSIIMTENIDDAWEAWLQQLNLYANYETNNNYCSLQKFEYV